MVQLLTTSKFIIVCPISPKRGFRPLTLVRGAGYAIDKKGKLVTVKKKKKLEFIIFNSFLFFNPHPRTGLLILEKGRQRGRERNINVREKRHSVASCTHPDQGLNMQPRHAP